MDLKYQAFTLPIWMAHNNTPYYYSAGITNAITFSVEYLYQQERRHPAGRSDCLDGRPARPPERAIGLDRHQ